MFVALQRASASALSKPFTLKYSLESAVEILHHYNSELKNILLRTL